jgi:hypothetical protein
MQYLDEDTVYDIHVKSDVVLEAVEILELIFARQETVRDAFKRAAETSLRHPRQAIADFAGTTEADLAHVKRRLARIEELRALLPEWMQVYVNPDSRA